MLPEPERRWREYLSGYVAAAELTWGPERVRVASVHAIAQEVSDPAVTDGDHERIRRRAASRSWRNDLAAAALTPWVTGHRFIVGGDWNTAVLFDQTYPGGAEGGPGASAQFFDARAQQGWRHALRKFSDVEVRTYLDPASAPYELDHIFTDDQLHTRVSSCEVLAGPPAGELSDHAPLVADIT